MTAKRLLTFFFPLFTLLPLLCQASALSLDPPNGSVAGVPGSSVSWSAQFTNSTNQYALLTASDLSLNLPPLGTYTDYVSPNFLVIGPNSISQPFLLGDFRIASSVQPGIIGSGVLTLQFDLYAQDPAGDSFDPTSYFGSDSTAAQVDITVQAPVTPPAITPEPSAFALLATGVSCLLLICKIRLERRIVPSFACALTLGVAATPASAGTSDAYHILRYSELGGEATCHSDADVTKTTGCCGSPGNHGCLSHEAGLFGCTDPSSNTIRVEPYTHAPICNLPKASCSSAISDAIRSGGDTFFVTSDVHFFRYHVNDLINHVAEMNNFSKQGFTWSNFFGLDPGTDANPIAEPRAVIVNGDLTLDSSMGNLAAFRLMYEKNTIPDSIHYPVFFGLGNHDTQTQVPSSEDAQRMFDYLTNAMHCGTSMDDGSDGSGNYSWDFNGTHFVQLNVWAGDQKGKYRKSTTGLDWLAADLAKSVGKSGRPVILNQHYPMESIGSGPNAAWTSDDFDKLWDVVRDYNVVAVFAGHTHLGRVVNSTNFAKNFTIKKTTDSLGNAKTLDGFTSSSGGDNQRGSFIVARVTPHYLDVGHVGWRSAGTAGLPPVYQMNLYFDGDRRSPNFVGNNDSEEIETNTVSQTANSCRKRINDRYVSVGPDVARLTPLDSKQDGNYTAQHLQIVQQNGQHLPGPVAVAVSADAPLANRTFVNTCAVSDDARAFVLLTDDQLALLNLGKPVTIDLRFKAPDLPPADYSLVNLTPLKWAQPDYVNLTAGVGTTPGQIGNAGPQLVQVSGIPNGTMKASISYQDSSATDWLVMKSTSTYNRFGYGEITLELNRDRLRLLVPTASQTLQAFLNITGGLPTDAYQIPIALHFKVATSVTFSIDPSASTDLSLHRPIFASAVHYASPAHTIDGNVAPHGVATLYERPVGSGQFAPISHFNVNSTQDTQGEGGALDCNLPPNDTVYFNYALDGSNPTRHCPSYMGGGDNTTPFSLQLPDGVYDFYVAYSGDSDYAPAQSPVVTYRLGPIASQIAIAAGNGQSTVIGARFMQPLAVRVTDVHGNPAKGVDVRFNPPGQANIANATFFGDTSAWADVRTDNSGIATAPLLTANSIVGSYQVEASLVGFPGWTSFDLTNLPVNGAADPQLAAMIVGRSGPLNQRTWQISLAQRGGRALTMPSLITAVSLQQTGGAACSSVPAVRSAFPITIHNLATEAPQLTIDFRGCRPTARFKVSITTVANGSVLNTSVLGNQFP